LKELVSGINGRAVCIYFFFIYVYAHPAGREVDVVVICIYTAHMYLFLHPVREAGNSVEVPVI